MVAKLAFTPQTKIWLFYALKDAGYIARVLCAIFLLCLLYYCFYLLLSEDLTVVRNYTIKIYWKPNNDISSSRGFLYVFVTWRFLLLHFFSTISINFLVLILAVVFFIVFFSLGFVVLSLSHLLFLGYLTPSCVRFLNYFKEGKKHFIV